MAHGRERAIRSQTPDETKEQDERDLRQRASSTGQARGDSDVQQESDFGTEPDADHTRDPKPFPTQRNRSGPDRKF